MDGVDENTPPPIPSFDKNKYRHPNSKHILQYNTNNSIVIEDDNDNSKDDNDDGGENGIKLIIYKL